LANMETVAIRISFGKVCIGSARHKLIGEASYHSFCFALTEQTLCIE
jgi:hypothetical protein